MIRPEWEWNARIMPRGNIKWPPIIISRKRKETSKIIQTTLIIRRKSPQIRKICDTVSRWMTTNIYSSHSLWVNKLTLLFLLERTWLIRKNKMFLFESTSSSDSILGEMVLHPKKSLIDLTSLSNVNKSSE